MARSPGQVPAFARGFFGQNLDADDPAISHRPRWDSTSAVKALLAPDMRQAVERSDAQDVVSMLPAGAESWDPLSRAQWFEMTTLLPGYILASQGDRMLMAHSVEGRFPFLDRDVIEFANGLPARHKLCGLDEKHLLKRAFADLVPEEILHRPKQPYRAPDAASFFSGDRPGWMEQVTSPAALEEAGVFDPALVAGLFAKCARRGGQRMGNTDNMRVLAVLSTQLVHQQFVVGDGAGPADETPPEPLMVVDLVHEMRSS
jgi:asparagine synthase (glutamine-hydrolysing)